MARKPRLEVEGGLYHLITRGVERRDIFHDKQDYEKFLSLLGVQKEKLPFFLYAYCLMTNHIHLLVERMTDDVGRIMHRVLTGYTQYYNRKYGRSGHLLQGRHKAILCQVGPDNLLSAVEDVCSVSKKDICGKAKNRRLVQAREVLILGGRRAGLSTTTLADLTGLSVATISRRHDAALSRLKHTPDLERQINKVIKWVK